MNTLISHRQQHDAPTKSVFLSNETICGDVTKVMTFFTSPEFKELDKRRLQVLSKLQTCPLKLYMRQYVDEHRVFGLGQKYLKLVDATENGGVFLNERALDEFLYNFKNFNTEDYLVRFQEFVTRLEAYYEEVAYENSLPNKVNTKGLRKRWINAVILLTAASLLVILFARLSTGN